MAALGFDQCAVSARESPTRVLMLLGGAGVELFELDEQPAMSSGAMPMPCPRPRCGNARPPSPTARRVSARLAGELDARSRIVVEHLLQPRRAMHDLASGRIDLQLDADALLRREPAQDVRAFADEPLEVDRSGRNSIFPASTLRQVEHVVDELQQVLAAGEDVAQILLVDSGAGPTSRRASAPRSR